MACWTAICHILAPPSAWEEPAGGEPGEWSGLPVITVNKKNKKTLQLKMYCAFFQFKQQYLDFFFFILMKLYQTHKSSWLV